MKKKQVQKVIDTFEKVLEEYPHLELDMMESEVNHNVCGTVHCHGGAYALGACDLNKPLDFNDGANQMAKDLGFVSGRPLEIWATKNPTIWGNDTGSRMFANRYAFQSLTRPDGAQSLEDIIQHWREVKERLID